MNFSELLIAYRAMKRMSQVELANKLEVSHNVITRWETGKTKPHKTTEYRVRSMLEKEVAKCQSEER